jgi:hypothetical protein
MCIPLAVSFGRMSPKASRPQPAIGAESQPVRKGPIRECKPIEPIIDDVEPGQQLFLAALQRKASSATASAVDVTESVTNPTFARQLRAATTAGRHRIAAGLTYIHVRRGSAVIRYEIVTNRLHVPHVHMCTIVEPTWGLDRHRLHPPPWHTYQVIHVSGLHRTRAAHSYQWHTRGGGCDVHTDTAHEELEYA